MSSSRSSPDSGTTGPWCWPYQNKWLSRLRKTFQALSGKWPKHLPMEGMSKNLHLALKRITRNWISTATFLGRETDMHSGAMARGASRGLWRTCWVQISFRKIISSMKGCSSSRSNSQKRGHGQPHGKQNHHACRLAATNDAMPKDRMQGMGRWKGVRQAFPHTCGGVRQNNLEKGWMC